MHPKNKVLFDSSALLTLIQEEKGYEILQDILASISMSSVNLGEVVAVLTRTGIPAHKIREILDSTGVDIISFNEKEAILSGSLITKTKPFGLSFGDRACIATGIIYGLKVYTTDKAWNNLEVDDLELVMVR